jgi:hypothetical protein
MRVELGGKLAHEFPEVDAALGREIENQPLAVERLLGLRQLHAEAALADLQRRDPVRVAPRCSCLSRNTMSSCVAIGSLRRRFARRRLPLGCLRHAGQRRRPRDRRRLDDDLFAGAARLAGLSRNVCGRPTGVSDRDEPWVRGHI